MSGPEPVWPTTTTVLHQQKLCVGGVETEKGVLVVLDKEGQPKCDLIVTFLSFDSRR